MVTELTRYTRGKLKRAYTYSDTMKHLTMYARFVNNIQKGLWLIMHFDEISTLIHVICYNIMPIPCVFVWGLRIDDLRIYVYSNLLKNWSLVHTIPYYRPQPIILADEMS